MGKLEQYGWSEIPDEPGKLEWLHKDQLRIDPAYQRSRVSTVRVNAIAAKWSWKACLLLAVIRRLDHSLWVFDGGTRLLAALKRPDIRELPCWVFDEKKIEREAEGFLAVNTVRGSMLMAERFRAMLISLDPDALAVNALIERYGYKIEPKAGQWRLACVKALLTEHRADCGVLEALFPLLCEICPSGEPLRDRLVQGACILERHLRRRDDSLLAQHHRVKLVAAGQQAILRQMTSTAEYHGKGGEKVCAEGIIMLLNHRRSSRRIKTLFD